MKALVTGMVGGFVVYGILTLLGVDLVTDYGFAKFAVILTGYITVGYIIGVNPK